MQPNGKESQTPIRLAEPHFLLCPLHHHALLLVLPTHALHTQGHSRRFREGLIHAAIPHRRALQVPQRANPFCNLQTLLVRNQLLLLLPPSDGLLWCPVFLLLCLVIVLPQVAFQGDQDELDARAVVGDLAHPLGFDVLERVAGVDGEAEHDCVGVVVGEGAQAVELLLARGVPEGELDVDIVYEDIWRRAGSSAVFDGTRGRKVQYHERSFQRLWAHTLSGST